MRHPIQPIEMIEEVARFKANGIVRRLLDDGPFDMNSIAHWEVSREDREQFAQLIGYSLSGFGELSYVSDETYNTAQAMHDRGMTEDTARIVILEEALSDARKGVKLAAVALFPIHPDDLEDQ